MRRVYRAILRLFPAEYQAAFADEMLDTFEQTLRNSPRPTLLAAGEMAALFKALVCEWKAKWQAPESYVTPRCRAHPASDLPQDIVEAQDQIAQLIRSMEFAIAHHDFPKARFYANQERIARAQLQRLLDA